MSRSSDTKFRSFSPFLAQSSSDPSELFDKHRETIHQQISQLPNSPRSKQKLEQVFEDLLKSVHFYTRPDIIPSPYSIVADSEQRSSSDPRLYLLQEELEKERALRKAVMSENERLTDRLGYLLNIEEQYEDYRRSLQKISELGTENEKLNTRIKILLSENEELRRKLGQASEVAISYKLSPSNENEANKNSELLRQLKEFKEAYEDLRRSYIKDVRGQQERCEELTEENLKLETKLRLLNESLNKPQKDTRNVVEDKIQDKIRNMKQDYREKLRKLERRFETNQANEVSDSHLRDMEERLAGYQEKLNQVNLSKPTSKKGISKDRFDSKKSSRNSTPSNEKDSYRSVYQLKQGNKELLQRQNRIYRSSNQKYSKSRSPGHSNSPAQSIRSQTSKSPSGAGLDRIPSERSLSRHRLYQIHNDCETCFKRHGHEWAKRPNNL